MSSSGVGPPAAIRSFTRGEHLLQLRAATGDDRGQRGERLGADRRLRNGTAWPAGFRCVAVIGSPGGRGIGSSAGHRRRTTPAGPRGPPRLRFARYTPPAAGTADGTDVSSGPAVGRRVERGAPVRAEDEHAGAAGRGQQQPRRQPQDQRLDPGVRVDPGQEAPAVGEQGHPDAAGGVAVDAVRHAGDPVEHHLGGPGLRAAQVEAGQPEQRGLRDEDGLLPASRVRVAQHAVDEVETLGDEARRPGLQVVAPQPAVGCQRDGLVQRVVLGGVGVVEGLGEVEAAAVGGDREVVADGQRAPPAAVDRRSSGASGSSSAWTTGRSSRRSVTGTSWTTSSTERSSSASRYTPTVPSPGPVP